MTDNHKDRDAIETIIRNEQILGILSALSGQKIIAALLSPQEKLLSLIEALKNQKPDENKNDYELELELEREFVWELDDNREPDFEWDVDYKQLKRQKQQEIEDDDPEFLQQEKAKEAFKERMREYDRNRFTSRDQEHDQGFDFEL